MATDAASLGTSPPARRRSPYSRVSIALHWIIALLIFGNLAGGFAFDLMLGSGDPKLRQAAFDGIQVHKAAGLTILALSLLRLAVRIAQGFPPLPDNMTAPARLLARVTHYGFYVFMIGMPLIGWAMVSASPLDFPISYFGLFDWPQLPLATSKALADSLATAHEYMAYAGILLLALHIAGALKHHFFDRDDVLTRMIPLLKVRRR